MPPTCFPFPRSSPVLCCTSRSRWCSGRKAVGRKRSPTDCWAFPSLAGELCGSHSISGALHRNSRVLALVWLPLLRARSCPCLWSWRSTKKKSAASNATCWRFRISIWRPPALWAARFNACCRRPWTACWALCGCRPARAHGLRSVVAISLQAKEQAFGVLLLGTPDSRRFTAAELRLLLALGHQIGMAVENSYLIQQTSRRSEELHVLNEIGRALSSTLNKEDLTRKVWEELRRLFDAENFYIASLESNSDEMTFDLEMIDGARLPKRARPAGNHITEFIIRTRQPVLIRD